ncbi:MAG: nitroreductase family protein [Angustibacter sp.]
MELSEVVGRRRMVRAYHPSRPVPDAVLDRVLRHAIRAPSAGFSQGWDFVVLHTSTSRDTFWRVTAPEPADRWLHGMRGAPVLLLCLSDPGSYLDRYAEPDKGWTDRDPQRWPIPYWDVDTGMAALLMLLTATDAGLGGCFFGVPPDRHEAVRLAFSIPTDRRLVGVVSLGYPAPGPGRRSASLRRGRRPLRDVAHDGRFGAPWPALIAADPSKTDPPDTAMPAGPEDGPARG